jgi:DNA-binding MarR family transcriptional regulator
MGIGLICWVLDSAPDDLSPLEYLTLVALAEWARDETGQCWPGRTALAGRLRRSERTTGRMLTELTRRGLIETVQPSAPGRHPVYQINAGQQVAHEHGTADGPRLHSTRDTQTPNVGQLATKRGPTGDPPLHPQEPSGSPHIRARADEFARVIEALRNETGKTIDNDHARRVIKQIVGDRAGIKDPIGYVCGAIAKDPNPERFLPTPIPGRYRKEDYQ